MENPLDSAGEAASKIGEGVGGFLHNTARFLEYLTGNVTAAIIFAGFLMFALWLIKSAAGARNHAIYGHSIRLLGLLGIIGLVVYCALATTAETDFMANTDPGYALTYKGLTGREYSPTTWDSFPQRFGQTAYQFRWYSVFFAIMMIVGTIVLLAAKPLRKALDSVKEPDPPLSH